MNKGKTRPFYLCYDKQDEGCKEWLGNQSNTKISDRQTSKEEFRRRINKSDFMKGNKDQSIAQRCGDG